MINLYKRYFIVLVVMTLILLLALGFAIGISTTLISKLPQACTDGHVARWNGSSWGCVPDRDTAYSAGAGLTRVDTVFDIDFAGSGRAATVARSDHNHDLVYMNAGARAGGDLSGAYPNPIVGSLQGRSVARTIPQPGQVLQWDGSAWTPTSAGYQNVLVVARSGGHFTSIQAALDSISGASQANPYLVWVAPGTYDEQVMMVPYVDIEGAGELVTRIVQGSVDTGTVVGADAAELRFLTVENSGGGDRAVAIYNDSSAPWLTLVTAIASGSDENYGVYNKNASPPMTDVTAIASGGSKAYGIYNSHASPTMRDVTAIASEGIKNYGIYNNDTASPAMTDVTATASEGDENYGLYNFYASPALKGVTVMASGNGRMNYGVFDVSDTLLAMTDVTVTALGADANCGIYHALSALEIVDVIVTASGGDKDTGLHLESSSATLLNSTIAGSTVGIYSHSDRADASYAVAIDHCQVRGQDATIDSAANFATRVGASLLDGGAVQGDTIKCAGVYDEDYTFYPDACP